MPRGPSLEDKSVAPAPSSPSSSSGAELGGDVSAVARYSLDQWRGLTERDPAAAELLADYWRAVGMPPETGAREPWSAAWVSWVVRHSAYPRALSPAAAHVYYARQALADRAAGRVGRYGAFEPSEVLLEPGDIVLRGRAGHAVTLADLSPSRRDFVPMHGDIVTSVDDASATIVGGNVGDRVAARALPLVGRRVEPDSPIVAVLKLIRAPGA